MMRSMYSGVSGLRNHQTRMDVIGNNIANVNTSGYKKSRVVFQDTLYQNMRGGSSPTDARGGTNPMSIGLGMSVASIDQIHTPAPAAATNKATDLAIDGNGYFIVDNGGQKFYTRAGNFDFDKFGNMYSLANGYRVNGWMADKASDDGSGNWEIDTVKASQPIDISSFRSVAPQATTEMKFSGNLNSNLKKVSNPDSDTENVVITSKQIYDSLGNKHDVYFRYYKNPIEGEQEINYIDNDGNITTANIVANKWNCQVSFDPDFPAPPSGSGDLTNTKTIADVIYFDEKGNVPKTYTHTDGNTYSIIPPTNRLTVEMTNGASDIELDIDFSSLTQWETNSTAWAEHQDGYTMGNLTSYTIGIDGVIQGV
ncbi:MAG TPA: flagellar hook-basal body complex protein, partial [Syntrophomonadaceae bacterium]|nr:flagellar hook-basal body complex protein [Syntrophomonadaceae bacterium]